MKKIFLIVITLFNVLILLGDIGSLKDKVFIIKGDSGQGSGFALKLKDKSYLCTNQHVLAGQSAFTAETIAGKNIELGERVLFPHDQRDVILIELKDQIEGLKLASKVNFDEIVNSFGNSGGENVITKKAGKIIGLGETEIEYDNPTVMGDSGSPVLNQEMEVVGVVTRGVKEMRANFWLDDKPEMHTRRFGTRINNVTWKQSSVKQIKRLSMIYNYVMDFEQKWVTSYRSTILNTERFFFLSQKLALPLAKNEGDKLDSSIFYRSSQCPRQYFGESTFSPNRFEFQGLKSSTTFKSDYAKKSPTYNEFKMLSPILNWQSDFEKFMAIGLNYTYGNNVSSYLILRYIFYKNFINDLRFATDLMEGLPLNWHSKEMNDRLDEIYLQTKDYFQELDSKTYDILYYLGARERIAYNKSGVKFIHQLSNADLLFFMYLDHDSIKLKKPFIYNQNIYKYFDACRSATPGKNNGAKATSSLIAKARSEKFKLCYESPAAQGWRFDKQLKDAVESAKSDGKFSYLTRLPLNNRAFFEFKTLELIQSEIREEFKNMNHEFYDQKNYDLKINNVYYLSSRYHSGSELELYVQLNNME